MIAGFPKLNEMLILVGGKTRKTKKTKKTKKTSKSRKGGGYGCGCV